MGRMSIFAVQATEQALSDAGIKHEELTSGRIGCIIGSTMGSAKSLNETFEIMLPKKDLTQLPKKDLTQLSSMKFFQCVSHTAAMNVSQCLGITGCVLATSAACASALQAVSVGYDLIRLGKQDFILRSPVLLMFFLQRRQTITTNHIERPGLLTETVMDWYAAREAEY